VATIKLPNLPLSLTVAQGSVWVTYRHGEESPEGLFRIDPRTRTVAERIYVAESPIGPSPADVALAPDSVWVVSPVTVVGAEAGFIVRWDLDAGRRTADIGIGTPVGIGVGPDSIWALQANGVVVRVDLVTHEVVAKIATSGGGAAIAVAEDAVWVVDRQKGTITRIDPATNKAGPPVGLGGKPSSVAAGEGNVWVRLDAA
jgi:streptogramin lyase